MITARFVLYTPEGETVGEEAMRADPALAQSLIADVGRTEAGLLIEAEKQGGEERGARAGLGDTLPVLMDRFCGAGLDALERDGALSVDFVDHEEKLAMTVTDGVLRMESTRFGQRSFPFVPYATALRACGARYRELMLALESPVPPEGAEAT